VSQNRRRILSDVPREAHVVTREGEVVECHLEQTGPLVWLAVPKRSLPANAHPLSGYVDVIPPGGSVRFLLEPSPRREP